ncbi:MAG: efflux RND transporter periplasmic adaptor subunit [Synechococcales cyanobacterium H12SWP_bin.12]|nr:efflux RND transporter periplasmic adaptor subunit [Synechococcales cyanobacterium H12SWP_bin.12]
MVSQQRQTPLLAMDHNLTTTSRFSADRRRRKRLLIAGVAAAVVGGGSLMWMLNSSLSSNRDLSDYTIDATRGSLPGVVTASGELEAIRRVNVSPKRQGLLEALLVDEGDRVEQGQVLARMDRGDFQDRLDELLAKARQAKADYEAKASDYRRRQTLFASGVISAVDRDEYRARYLSSKANFEAAQERIQQRDVEGSELLVRAPFNGVITERYAEPGSFVTPTTTASTSAGATSSSIVELSQGLEVTAKVPESDLSRIKIGQVANVRVDAFPDQSFAAEVRDIAPRAEKTNNVISFEVELTLLNPPPILRIGMTADVNFQTGRTAESTLVPTVAIVTEDGKPGVLLVGKNDQPTFQAIELGASGGSQSAILSGVKPGTRVFIDLPPWAKQRD